MVFFFFCEWISKIVHIALVDFSQIAKYFLDLDTAIVVIFSVPSCPCKKY